MKPTRRLCLTLVLGLSVIYGPSGCGRRHAEPRRDLATPTVSVEVVPYPSGPWWRADTNYTLQGASHILITHAGSSLKERLTAVLGPVSKRSRSQALDLAQRIAREVAADPASFDSQAIKYSEDVRTALNGGLLGAVFVPHMPKSMVDALGNLKVGEVSRVVESALGFHIIKRMPVPAEELVSGQEITLAYLGSLAPTRPDVVVTRTREEALTLATKVLAEARERPANFGELVAKHSESITAQNQGDYGEWSTYARDADPLVLYTLQGMSPGQISNVIDTPHGLRIFKRAAARPRETFGVRGILFAYRRDGAQETDPPITRSREEARSKAQKVLAQLHGAPERFEELARENCDLDGCHRGVFMAREGVRSGGLPAALARVPVGAVARELVEFPGHFVIARREDPATIPADIQPPVTTELPRPAFVGIEVATPAQLVWYVGQLREKALEELKLDADAAARFSQLMENLAQAYATLEPAGRAQLTHTTDLELAALLGPQRAERFNQVHARLLKEVMGSVERTQ